MMEKRQDRTLALLLVTRRLYWLLFVVFSLLGSQATLDDQYQSIFDYTKHGYQNYLVPQDTTSLQIDAWGASGGDFGHSLGGFGGYISTNISVNPGQILYVYVGKRGTRSNHTWIGSEGGEDTEIRMQKDNNVDSRVVVAGGGGGAGWWNSGGTGGRLTSASFLRVEGRNDGERGNDLGTGRRAMSMGKSGVLFGGTGGHSFTTGRQLFSQEGVRHGHGKVIIQRLQRQQQRRREVEQRVGNVDGIVLTAANTPTPIPTMIPTVLPTRGPTSRTPTAFPTIATKTPTKTPTISPTIATKSPTVKPTRFPSSMPSGQPTRHPNGHPTSQPTRAPVGHPTGQPSRYIP